MASNHTTAKPDRPAKPHPDFPLFPHASGRWAKKVRGKFVYFGPWRDPDAALEKWLDQKDDLLAGRKPRVKGNADGLTVRELVNHYLSAKARKVAAGEMQERSWLELKVNGEIVASVFGKNRLVSDLASDDFGELRAAFAKTRGPEALGNQVQKTRCLFKYAYDAGLIDRPVRFGPEFHRPSKATRRKNRQARPTRMFTAEEIHKLLEIATVPMKAMILLGINTGMGNSDCSDLRHRHLDLDKRVLDYPRPKTSIERRAILWKETVAAIREAIAVRPDPKDPDDDDRVFVTKFGLPWVKYREKGNINAVTLEFGKLLKTIGIDRTGCNFYALRHMFETIGGETADQPAVDRVMGHERADMASIYREWRKDDREDARLLKVSRHVHKWLFGKDKKK